MPIRRAILSVSDKSGIVDLARALAARGVEILSTGGTAKHLADAGVPVTPVAQYSGAPEAFGGRVKTLTPKVFGGILYDRSKADHVADAEKHGIGPIDLVVVNLYPFEATVAREGVTVDEAVEQIDIGGPSMLRAAAKNHRHVVVLCDPSLYAEFLAELESGKISDGFRRKAAVDVFHKTSRYDDGIAEFLGRDGAPAGELAEAIRLDLRKMQPLRYGENPQQTAAFYRFAEAPAAFEQLHGKELSYNNLIDLDAAWKLAGAFDAPSTVVIKHTNPCGVGTAATLVESTKLAIEADPVSAFGGIVGVNRTLDAATAEAIGTLFLEVIVAPAFEERALAILTKKKNVRLIAAQQTSRPWEVRSAAGGLLVQGPDTFGPPSEWKCVTKRAATEGELAALRFAWTVCAHVKSNAIVITGKAQTVGVGAGQMSRVDSAKLAVMKATVPVAGCVAASDAFFPFRDGLDILAQAGIVAIVQPGGSVRDDEVITAADEHGIAMVFTGERHFRH
jgi:phosphoribosylaminoimidazolecarboxamide formyltransferase/IMP cyclohydrolase